MGIYQCTVKFKNTRGECSSEPYYIQNKNSHLEAMTEFRIMAAYRKQLLAAGIAIYSLRVSDVAIKRDGFTDYITALNGSNNGPVLPATAYSDVIYNRLMLRMYTTGFTNWGWKFLVGIPDDVCKQMGDMDLARSAFPTWTDALGVFRDYLTNNGAGGNWGLYGVEKPNPPVPHYTISLVEVNVDLTVNITTNVANGYIVNDRVKLSGGVLTPWLKSGFYKVAAIVNPTTFTIQSAMVPGPAIIDQPGKVQRANFFFFPWTNIQPVRFTSRQGARPSDMRPGRRRARRLIAA